MSFLKTLINFNALFVLVIIALIWSNWNLNKRINRLKNKINKINIIIDHNNLQSPPYIKYLTESDE